MFDKFKAWLKSPKGLQIATALVAAAFVAKQVLPANTVGYHVADAILGYGVAHSISVTPASKA